MPTTRSQGKKRVIASTDKPNKKAKISAVTVTEETADRTKTKVKDELRALKKKESETKKALAASQKKLRQELAAAEKRKKQESQEKRQAEIDASKARSQDIIAKKARQKHHKEHWTLYCKTNDLSGSTLDAEPENSINQTDASKLYHLTSAELGCLKHFPDNVNLYEKNRKLFDEDEVKQLAWRKYAICAGIDDGGEGILLSRGKDL